MGDDSSKGEGNVSSSDELQPFEVIVERSTLVLFGGMKVGFTNCILYLWRCRRSRFVLRKRVRRTPRVISTIFHQRVAFSIPQGGITLDVE